MKDHPERPSSRATTQRLAIVPVTLAEANGLVERLHRHHGPVAGHKLSIGCARLADGELAGVAIVGRPVSRGLDDGWTLEVLRLATDGTPNACSLLYGAAARAAFALGYRRIVTYVRARESGVSLRAAGWVRAGEVRGRSWSCPARPRATRHAVEDRIRYERVRGGTWPALPSLVRPPARQAVLPALDLFEGVSG